MRKGIHPEYHLIKVTCSCGNKFEVGSTLKKESLNIEVCDKCHPFYTRQQKIIDTTGRVEKYKSRYDRQKPVAGSTKAEIEAKVKEAVAKGKAASAKKPVTAKPKAKPTTPAKAPAPVKKAASPEKVDAPKVTKNTKATKEAKEKK